MILYSIDPSYEGANPAECSTFFGPEEAVPGNLRVQSLETLAGKLIRIDPATGNILFRIDGYPSIHPSIYLPPYGHLPLIPLSICLGAGIGTDNFPNLTPNPYYNVSDPHSYRSIIYASGLRNPFKVTIR